MTINAPRLQSIVERIESVEREQEEIAGAKRDIYAEAKGVGYDVKTLRKVIAARKMNPADRAEQETLFDTYMHALGERVESAVRAVHAGALSMREAAKQAGVSKSAIQRSVPKEGAAPDLGTPAASSDSEAMAAMLESKERLDALKRQKGLAA